MVLCDFINFIISVRMRAEVYFTSCTHDVERTMYCVSDSQTFIHGPKCMLYVTTLFELTELVIQIGSFIYCDLDSAYVAKRISLMGHLV